MQGLENSIVVVTGGGGGIGSATCLRLAQEGARVAVLDRDLAAAQATAERIQNHQGQALALACDITQRAQVDAAIQAIHQAWGAVNVLVNNAGWDVFKPFTQTTEQDWERLIAINLTGALHMHHAVLPDMVEQKRGRIVNVASDAARVGSSGEAVYAACKGGLVAFSKTLAREHARHNITVNVVCPGPTDTALLAGVTDAAPNPEKLRDAFVKAIPLGRLGQPQDLASAIAFFASDDASFITGQVLSVSGGLTMNG